MTSRLTGGKFQRVSFTDATETRRSDSLRKPMLLLWLAAAIAMLLFVGGPDVSRTQEARVLETAREMLASGWRGWIVPHINGQVRLEKPPLAYWLAAVSFKIFGVGAGAGRLPFALIGWLMIGLVYRIGYQLFNRQAGIAAAAALLGSYLFFWATRLAETDGPAALFTTAAVWWAWRGLNFDRWIDLQISAIAVGVSLGTGPGTPHRRSSGSSERSPAPGPGAAGFPGQRPVASPRRASADLAA